MHVVSYWSDTTEISQNSNQQYTHAVLQALEQNCEDYKELDHHELMTWTQYQV